jgi:hypothetical protein
MDVNIYHHFVSNDAKLDRILALLGKLQSEGQKMSGELEALTTQVASNTSAEQSAVLLLTRLHDLLVASQNDPTKLADLVNQLAVSRDALAAAVVANTPTS